MSKNDEIKPGYTRISAISSAFAGYGKIPQNVLDKAADRGGQVHDVIFDYMNDIPIPEEKWWFEGKSIQGYFNSFLKFWELFKDSAIVLQEERFYDDILMITGKPDLVIKKDGKVILIDWKCTSAIGKHWDIQSDGYASLLRHGYIEGKDKNSHIVNESIFVRLDKDGKEPETIAYSPFVKNFVNMKSIYDKYFMNLTCNLENE